MTKFYSNENFPLGLVETLREMKYEVLTSYQAGQANQRIDDLSVLKFAHEKERVVITLNREDFIALHKQGKPHHGIIIFKEDPDFWGQANTINQFLLEDNQSLQGRLIRIKKSNQPGSATKIFIIQEY